MMVLSDMALKTGLAASQAEKDDPKLLTHKRAH